ncbi:ATP-grasp domain-containing protein [Streptomyces sp. NBC_01104]|uniref:ATP-grasp domain-containing protein n=1 Tax=Streptomyces sp. NBC_01104 TaxID=2903750 RepID=UPI00386E0DBA|nr:ATP-grasp domain-containing protein [Streptomyces sp. NBC_01104]
MTWFALLESNTTGTGREFCVRARARGMRPVLLTRDPGRYPYVAEDGIDTRVLDTGDLGAVLDTCTALAADGGLSGLVSSSEYFVAPAAHAAAKLGLPAADGDAVDRCRAKDTQRLALEAGGVAVPAFRSVETVADAGHAADALGYPVVLKPTTGSGSVGVRLCRDGDETRQWAGELLGRATDERGNPVPTRILVEVAVEGPEFSVETFDGAVVAVVAKHLGPEPYFVETGHDIPAPVPDATAAALADTTLRSLAALGLGWGAAHTELRLSGGRPVVIEVNPRLAGGMIPVAVRAALGIDLVDSVVALAAGQQPDAAGSGAGHAAVRFLRAGQEGRIVAVDGVEDALAGPGVVTVRAGVAAGGVVRLTNSFQDRLALVVSEGPDTDSATRGAEAALRQIRIRFEVPASPAAPHAQQDTPENGLEEGAGDR